MTPVRRISKQQWELLRHLAAGASPTDDEGAADGEHTAAWLAERLGRRPDAVVLSLKRLPSPWVTFRADPSGKRVGRGVPAGYWSVTDTGRERLEEMQGPPSEADTVSVDPGVEGNGRAVDSGRPSLRESSSARPDDGGTEDTPGNAWVISRHQTFVVASVTSREVPRLLDVLAEGQQSVDASFVARVDGERHAYVFVFDDAFGARPSEALSSALGAAGLPFTLGAIGEVRSMTSLVRDARAARAAAAAVRKPSDQ